MVDSTCRSCRSVDAAECLALKTSDAVCSVDVLVCSVWLGVSPSRNPAAVGSVAVASAIASDDAAFT